MSEKLFSQALLSEHLMVIDSQAYRPMDDIIQQIQSIEDPTKKLCLALPYTTMHKHREQIASLNVWRGLSDIPPVTPGAFSEIAAIRLALEAKVDFVVIGDTTARHVLYESDQSIAAKLRALLAAEITPVVCFGETLQDHIRGTSPQIIQEQLTALLLGLTFNQVTQVILVYKCPWINYTAPENFADEYDKVHNSVLDAMHHLFGKDAVSHIPMLTDLPLASEDFSLIAYDIPPSGYFLEIEGRTPQLIADYFHILTHTTPKSTKVRKAPKIPEPVKEPEPPAPAPEPAKKAGRPRKKALVEEEPPELESLSESVEESIHETILSVEDELEDTTIHFEAHDPTELAGEDSSGEDFEFEWYSDEELESLRKEFGILPDGTRALQPLPVWDNSRPVKIIKTQAQKAEKAKKKTPKKKPL